MQLGRGVAAAVSAVLGAGLLLGCTADDGADRDPGATVTDDEARTLAGLLQRNFQRGGADFVATAPYGGNAVLTVTGSVDFRASTGRARVTTDLGDGRPDRSAEVVFTTEEVWIGEAPGLTEGLTAAGLPGVRWLRRPLGPDGTAELLDVVLRVVLNLGSAPADDPRSFVERDWTWQGRRSIDGRLTSVFTDPAARSVAVDAADDVLLQYATPLPGESFEVTVTLTEHGRRSVEVPDAASSAPAADHPEIAGGLGL
jgi:hypothetical protein